MENRKLCPMSMSQTGKAPSNCQRDYCAWYMSGDCAINRIARNNSKVEPADRRAELDAHFVDGVHPEDNYLEVLNWYRNLYYTENSNTERGIMARAINDLFMAMSSKEDRRFPDADASYSEAIKASYERGAGKEIIQSDKAQRFLNK